MARQGPKFKTGGMPSSLQTARRLGPARSAASGVIRPMFSSPPEEQPAVRTRMSLAMSSFVRAAVRVSWP